MSKLTDVIEQNICEDTQKLGYEIEYVEYVKEGKNKILRIVIDKKDGLINTEDCEKVSRTLEDKIDKLMKNDETYILEISSPGLERQLKNTKLFKKYIGSKVKLKLFKKSGNLKEIIGTLIDVNENNIIVLQNDDKLIIERANISCANTVYDF